MLSTFDYEKLGSLLQDFHHMTGIRITVFDDTFHEIIAYPEKIPGICSFIRSDPSADQACRNCDINACRTAMARHAPYVYRCHAGLTEAVAPVYMGGLPIAYLLFGHLFSYSSREEGTQEIVSSCSGYNLDSEHLRDLLGSLSVTEEDYILSASHILQAVASYLCMERMITLRQQETMTKIDSYITSHFSDELDAAFLCDRFGVGKTSLYAFAKQNYGCGIAEHIRQLRIEHAKRLLKEEPALTISEIAGMCGFSDYNYFITVFGKVVGMSPRKYRIAYS